MNLSLSSISLISNQPVTLLRLFTANTYSRRRLPTHLASHIQIL